MQQLPSRSSSKKKKTVGRFNWNSKIIWEDAHIHGNNGMIFRIINDPNAPFYQYKYTEMKEYERNHR